MDLFDSYKKACWVKKSANLRCSYQLASGPKKFQGQGQGHLGIYSWMISLLLLRLDMPKAPPINVMCGFSNFPFCLLSNTWWVISRPWSYEYYMTDGLVWVATLSQWPLLLKSTFVPNEVRFSMYSPFSPWIVEHAGLTWITHDCCKPPTCDVFRTLISSWPNLVYRTKSSLKWPTLAVQFNDFSADIGRPAEKDSKWPLLHILPSERVSFWTSTN